MPDIGVDSFLMNDLRLILIIAGIIIIAIIYLTGRKGKRSPGTAVNGVKVTESGQSSLSSHGDKPPFRDFSQDYLEGEEDYLLDSEADFESLTNDDFYRTNEPTKKNVAATGPASQQDNIICSEPYIPAVELPPNMQPMIICVNVISPRGSMFSAEKVKASLEATALIYGDMQIYHYFESMGPAQFSKKQKVFSVASAVEPGRFNPAKLSSYQTAGLSLFLQLPGPIDGVLAFERMCQLAKYFAGRLGGVFCDEKYNKMTIQGMANIKDEISAYNLKLRTINRQSMH